MFALHNNRTQGLYPACAGTLVHPVNPHSAHEGRLPNSECTISQYTCNAGITCAEQWIILPLMMSTEAASLALWKLSQVYWGTRSFRPGL